MRIALGIAVALVGCASTPNHPALAARSSQPVLCSVQADTRMPPEARAAATNELLRRSQTCSPEIVSAGIAERQAISAQRRANDEAVNRALIETGAAIIQANQPPPRPPQTRCTTTYIGNQAHTVCN